MSTKNLCGSAFWAIPTITTPPFHFHAFEETEEDNRLIGEQILGLATIEGNIAIKVPNNMIDTPREENIYAVFCGAIKLFTIYVLYNPVTVEYAFARCHVRGWMSVELKHLDDSLLTHTDERRLDLLLNSFLT